MSDEKNNAIAFKVIDDNTLTITKPIYIIYNGSIELISAETIVIPAQFYFTENEIDAQNIFNALKNDNYAELDNYDYYTINNYEFIKLNYIEASNIIVYPNKYQKLFAETEISDLDNKEDTSEEKIDNNTEVNIDESDNDENLAKGIKNVVLLMQFDESAIGKTIIESYEVALTASVLLRQFEIFPNSISHIKDPHRLYLLFENLIENKLDFNTYSLYYELIISQLLYCEDKEKLWRLTKDCNNPKFLNLKQSIQKLHPIRALYFENLGATIQKLPFIKKQDLSTMDNYLLGNYNYFKERGNKKD